VLLIQVQATVTLADQAIYFNGDILTMAGDSPEYVEAIVVEGGRITFAGTKAAALQRLAKDAAMVDLHGHTLLPGFIDTHGHMVYFGKNLMDQSLAGVQNIPELISRMKQYVERVPGDGWIVGMGYAPLKMKEQRHPTAAELDQISAERSVLVVHSSGHGGSMNHALMRLLKIDKSTTDPEGGWGICAGVWKSATSGANGRNRTDQCTQFAPPFLLVRCLATHCGGCQNLGKPWSDNGSGEWVGC